MMVAQESGSVSVLKDVGWHNVLLIMCGWLGVAKWLKEYWIENQKALARPGLHGAFIVLCAQSTYNKYLPNDYILPFLEG